MQIFSEMIVIFGFFGITIFPEKNKKKNKHREQKHIFIDDGN